MLSWPQSAYLSIPQAAALVCPWTLRSHSTASVWVPPLHTHTRKAHRVTLLHIAFTNTLISHGPGEWVEELTAFFFFFFYLIQLQQLLHLFLDWFNTFRTQITLHPLGIKGEEGSVKTLSLLQDTCASLHDLRMHAPFFHGIRVGVWVLFLFQL